MKGVLDNAVKRNKDLQSMLDDMKNIENSITENGQKWNADLSGYSNQITTRVLTTEANRSDRVANRNNWLNDLQNKINGKLDIGKSASNKLGDTTKVDGGKLDSAGEVNLSDEDLKYLKDFAEQDFINKFTSATLAPNVTVTFGDVHETADIDKVKDRITEILEEEIAEVAEGVY